MPQCSVSPAALGETRSQRLPCLSSSRLTLSELREGAGERPPSLGWFAVALYAHGLARPHAPPVLQVEALRPGRLGHRHVEDG